MKKLLSTAIYSSIFLLSLCQLCPAAIPTEFKLTASDGESKEAFGYAVSIDCDRCIVGAFGDDDNGDLSGSAYIFEWNGTSWSQKAKLTASATKNSKLLRPLPVLPPPLFTVTTTMAFRTDYTQCVV